MARGIQNFPRIKTPDSDYPNGRLKDKSGSEAGTPINEFTNGDLQQFFAKLMRVAGITPNGLPDNEYNGNQYFKSLFGFNTDHFLIPLAKSLMQNYITNDIVIFYGVSMSVSSNIITWTAGSIFYNNKIYLVNAGTYTKPGCSFCFYISDEENGFISISDNCSVTSIGVYNASSVKLLMNIMSGVLSKTAFSYLNSYTGGAFYYKDVFGNVRFTGIVQSPSSGVTPVFAILPTGYKPSVAKNFPVGLFGPTQTGVICYIEVNGECRLYDSSDGGAVDATKEFDLCSVNFNINV